MKGSRLAGLAAATVAVAASVAAARALGRSRSVPSAPITETGRAVRTRRIAGVGARSGPAYVSTRARSVFADAARREELDAEFQLRTAEEVARELGQMKGALMKLGQMANYLDQGLPEPVRDALVGLQHDAPSMSPELAAGVVETELGHRRPRPSPSGTRSRSRRRRSARCTER